MANIEIYTKATCPFCHRAKALLNRKGVAFSELPIDGDAVKRILAAATISMRWTRVAGWIRCCVNAL